MKKLPYSSPELVFMALVMFGPMAVSGIWYPGTLSGFFMRYLAGAGIGLVLWFAYLFLLCAWYDRKNKTRPPSPPKA